MLDAVANWLLPQLILFLVVSCFAGSIALLLGVGFAGDIFHAPHERHLATRVGGVLLVLTGVAGWVLPWLALWYWYHAR